ncbi:claudin-34-like [Onychomys torridus]|uniref:claudin-34-like n=1 Tax=Onychomys torridus TaxID=38674 RepID=UPI00167FCDFA|nr:claudin-34-like [Onychomys torridus]
MIIKKRCNYEMGGFALTTLAWIICCISMGLPEWRVWYFQDPVSSKPTTAFVGMWRVCAFNHDDRIRNIRKCRQYHYHDIFIPLDIQVVQQLLLVSSFLGLVGKITTIISLWNVYVGRVEKNAIHNPFGLSGMLNVTASSFISLAVLLNFVSILLKEGIAFPPSFHMPSHPDAQEIGSAMTLAIISAILFLLSGIILLSSNISRGKSAHNKI